MRAVSSVYAGRRSPSLLYNVLDSSSLALNHCRYSHIEVCNELLVKFDKKREFAVP